MTIIHDEEFTLLEAIEELRFAAIQDQSFDNDRPWSYTDNCNHCGGVKSFLDWIENRVKLLQKSHNIEEIKNERKKSP